jgi:hypothetical protein
MIQLSARQYEHRAESRGNRYGLDRLLVHVEVDDINVAPLVFLR